MPIVPLNKNVANRYILFFLIGWTLLNVLQASTLGLHSDSAYYWVYSRFLDWGYYDHPPMVAIFIRLGSTLLHNELGLRLLTIITSTLSIYVLWLIASRYRADVRWFILLVSGTFIFHIYGFTTTPDAPLFFFTVLFYYVYQRYAERDRWLLALLLAVIIACLLYSKYHAVLLLFFTVLSNWKLLKRPSFWVIVILSAILYLPHILWQVHHNYPSVTYHLFERSSETYDFAHTYLFIPGQLLMAGPLIGWFIFCFAFGTRISDSFIRALVVNAAGVFLFFLANTIKGNVQPHWTLIGFVPLVLLTLIHLKQQIRQPKWLFKLAVANAVLIITFRLLLGLGLPPLKKLRPLQSYYDYNVWSQQIKQKVGNAYVVMTYGFQEPSKYNYYTNSLRGFSYDTRDYRRTQYDIWPIEDSLQHQKVYYLSNYVVPGITTDTLHTVKGDYYGTWVNNARTYQKIDIQTDNYKIKVKPGQVFTFNLKFINPYPYTVNFSNNGQEHEAVLNACFFQGDDLKSAEHTGESFNRISIPAGKSTEYAFKVKAPLQPGRYDLIFSIRTSPFPGGRNSRIINFTVE